MADEEEIVEFDGEWPKGVPTLVRMDGVVYRHYDMFDYFASKIGADTTPLDSGIDN